MNFVDNNPEVVSIPKRVSEALKLAGRIDGASGILVSIPKRVSEALKQHPIKFRIIDLAQVSIPKRVSEALKRQAI